MDLRKLGAALLVLGGCLVWAKEKEPKNPQKLGHLLIEVISLTSPEELSGPTHPIARKPSPGQYFVDIHITIKNLDKKLAICASLKPTLKEEFGLRNQQPIDTITYVSQLLPGEQIEGDYVFILKKGVRPLEFSLDPVGESGYNEGCRSANVEDQSLKDTIRNLGRWPTSVQSVHFQLKDIPPTPVPSKGSEEVPK